MKRTTALLAIALAVFAAPAARADETNKIVEGVMNLILYDKMCAPLVGHHRRQAELAAKVVIKEVPRNMLNATADRVMTAHKRAGTARYCVAMKAKMRAAEHLLR